MPAKKKASRGSRKKPSQTSPKFMEKLKQFVRTKGMDYLRDHNISSVGIGYKRKDGKPTGEISIQFTVDQKASPEVLEAMGTTPIPESSSLTASKFRRT